MTEDRRDSVPTDLRAALEEFATHPTLIVALDFDGTLAALHDDPQAVRPTDAAARAVHAVAGLDGVEVALVSGRPAGDLKRLADPPAGTILIGSHGAETGEVRADGEVELTDTGITDDERARRDALAAELEKIVEGREGAWVEYKPLAVVLHTRLASEEDRDAVTRAVLDGPANWEGVHAMQGKNVVELPVRSATKGDALRTLREARSEATGQHVPILYAGDDVTDERAFAVLEPGDVTVKVGDGETLASHRVAEPDDVAAVLEVLHDLRSS